MNVILFEPDEVGETIILDDADRRARHLRSVLRTSTGSEVRIGAIGGRLGTARVRLDASSIALTDVTLDHDPPPPLPLTLVLALPRPKVLNRVIASVASMGIKQIHLINSWRVDKAYWKSPKLERANLRVQSVIGLEQGVDTILPEIVPHRLFRPFVERELEAVAGDSVRLLAHPRDAEDCPRGIDSPVTLVIGPEGGFIEAEIESLRARKFSAVRIGPRVLRVETAVAALIGRLT
jgi:RsmE family RNA methyltransferase